jgi:exopolysaccharide production protein ExoQ
LLGLPFVNKRKISIYFLGAIIFFAAANSMFDIYATVVHGVGRNLTLTDRTNIWGTVLKLQPDPIFGVGFESFWLGDRLLAVWRTLPGEMGISEAHNGYLETYLNLGIVGLSIFASMLLATYFKICRDLVRRFEFGRLRMGLFIAIISFNFTEAAFVNLHFIYAIFFLIAVEYPMVRRSRLLRSPAPVRKEAEREILTAEGALSRPSSAQPCTNMAG